MLVRETNFDITAAAFSFIRFEFTEYVCLGVSDSKVCPSLVDIVKRETTNPEAKLDQSELLTGIVVVFVFL